MTQLSPLPRLEPHWFSTFANQLSIAQTLAAFGGEVDLFLLGDSITDGAVYRPEFSQPLGSPKMVNFGIGGDSTRNVRWRIRHGMLDGLRPRVATLLIGINDFWSQTPAEDIAAGAIDIGHSMRLKMPDTRIFHFGIFPLGAALQRLNEKVEAVNRLIEPAAASYGATYVSMKDDFLLPDGTERPGMLSADGVHLNALAYARWAEHLRDLINGT